MKKKKLAVLALVLIIVPLALFLLTFDNKLPNIPFVSRLYNAGSDLKGYYQIKSKLENLKLNDNSNYGSILNELGVLENKKLTPKERYAALVNISFYFEKIYTRIPNPLVYKLATSDLKIFAEENFKEEFKNSDFLIPCQDPSCAQSKTPDEILKIIDDINSYDKIPSYVKKTHVSNLLYASYYHDTNPRPKISAYLISALEIKNDKDFIAADANKKIFDEIIDFIKNKYPDEYAKLPKIAHDEINK